MKGSKNNTIQLIKEQGNVIYDNKFLLTDEASYLFDKMQKNIVWTQYPITIFGKTVLQPRLVAWHGDKGIQYKYSQTCLVAEGWTEELLFIKKRLKTAYDLDFNSVLLNYYRDGQDSMGWHSDDEKELGPQPIIASVSLGAERRFDFRLRRVGTLLCKVPTRRNQSITLESGSLLIMQGETQTYWQHQIAKTKKVKEPRINLTFRTIIS